MRTQWHHTSDINDTFFTGLGGASSLGGGGGNAHRGEGKGGGSSSQMDEDEEGSGSTVRKGPDLLRTPMNAFQELALNGLELYEREERNLNILFFARLLNIIQSWAVMQREKNKSTQIIKAHVKNRR